MKLIYSLFICTVVIILASCAGEENGSSSQSASSNGTISLSSSSVDQNLGTSALLPITIDSDNFDGTISLSLNRVVLDNEMDAGSDIETSLSQSSVTVTNNSSTQVSLNVVVKASAPSFSSTNNNGSGKVTVVATPSEGDSVSLDIPFQVNAVYETRLSVDGADPDGDHSWSQPTEDTFRYHPDGLMVIFVNTDTNNHRVHSGNAIPHQPPGESMDASSSDGVDGGTYAVMVDQSRDDATYWCHDHENGGDGRTLSFTDE